VSARCTISPSMRTVIVAAAVVVEGGQVLLTRRKPGTHLAGAWEFPGGKVEPGEDPRAALRRELDEELGIDVSVGEIVDVTFHRYAGQASVRSQGPVPKVDAGVDAAVDGAEDKAVLLLFFEATRAPHSAEPRARDVAAFRWAAAGELDPALFPPADVAVLRKVAERLSGSRREIEK
jgi:8-oxo-dGTP diphosphatase